MPTNFLSFDTPTTPAQIDRRKAMATALKVKQPVKHPLQAIDNAVGDITGAFLDRQAAQGEDARRKALADALQGIAPGGLDPKVYGALIENDPESAMKIVAQSQMGAADRSNEMTDWKAKQQWERDNPAPAAPTSEMRNWEYGQQNPDFAAAQNAGGMFDGKSVDGQSLNFLVKEYEESGGQKGISREQAAQFGAGKIFTDPTDGSQNFVTPDGIFHNVPKGAAPDASAPPPDAGAPPPDAGPATPAPIAEPLPKIGGPDEPMPAGAAAAPAAVAPPAGVAPVVVPPPPASAAPPAGPPANPGIIPITGPKAVKPTESQRNRVSQVNQAITAVNTELDRYADLVSKSGIEAAPGPGKDNLNTSRQGIMLQLKELFNLGVLNGPDLQLMEKMIYDPVVDPMKEGGLANLPGQAMTAVGIGGSAGERATNSVGELKRMLGGIQQSVLSTNPAAGAQDTPPAAGDIPSSVPGVKIKKLSN